jgi:transmembrane sensor
MAAMAYGRVLLDDLGRPRDAARAFAQVRALPGHAGLDEDALAREAEAWWKAGDRHRAEARAREYLRRFPDGAQLGSVRRYDPRPTGQP